MVDADAMNASINAGFKLGLEVGRKDAVSKYKTMVLAPALQDMLDLCPGFASKLIQTKSVLYEDFHVLWSKIRILSETLINEVEDPKMEK